MNQETYDNMIAAAPKALAENDLRVARLATRDPTRNPKSGDVVRGVRRNPGIHIGQLATITVQAVAGNLVGSTSTGTGDKQVLWQRLEDWCQLDAWISHWEVLHHAGD